MKISPKLRFEAIQVERFFRQVLMVVVSILISFAFTSWFDSCKRKKDIEVTLDYVKDELLANKDMLDSVIVTLRSNAAGYRFLTANYERIDEISPDSLLLNMKRSTKWRLIEYRDYALTALKDCARYEELSNSLMLSINFTYGVAHLQMKEVEQFFAETRAIYEISNEKIYLSGDDPTAIDIFKSLVSIHKFRTRLFNDYINNTLIPETIDASTALGESIALLDSLIVSGDYDNYK